MKHPVYIPPEDTLQALRDTQKRFGRLSKVLIRRAWRTGDWKGFLDIDYPALQRMRNANGGIRYLNLVVLSKL